MSGACLKACGYPLRACEWAGEGGEGGEEADDDSGGGGGGGGDGGDGGGGEGATGQLQVGTWLPGGSQCRVAYFS